MQRPVSFAQHDEQHPTGQNIAGSPVSCNGVHSETKVSNRFGPFSRQASWGIVPTKLLYCRVRCCNLTMPPISDGIVPENWLLANWYLVIPVSPPIIVLRVPENEFDSRLKRQPLVKLKNASGKVPLNLLPSQKKSNNNDNFPNSEGRLPVNEFLASLSLYK